MTTKYTPAQEQFLLDCAIRFKAETFNNIEAYHNFDNKSLLEHAKEMLKAAQDEGLMV